MSTKPNVPPPSVPIVGPNGLITKDWYRFFSELSLTGAVDTSATGGSATALPAQPVGYHTQIISGSPKRIAHYDP